MRPFQDFHEFYSPMTQDRLGQGGYGAGDCRRSPAVKVWGKVVIDGVLSLMVTNFILCITLYYGGTWWLNW